MVDEPMTTETTETGTAEAPAALPTPTPSMEPVNPAPDHAAAENLMPVAGGSQSPRWNSVLVNQTIRTAMPTAEGIADKQIGAVLAGLVGIAPKDELEAMMAAQLIGLHNASLEAMRRAMIREQSPEGYALALSQANKCSRTFGVLVEALSRYRGKGGQQRVTVEHVHVHAGGQVVVGAVDTGGRGTPGKQRSTP